MNIFMPYTCWNEVRSTKAAWIRIGFYLVSSRMRFRRGPAAAQLILLRRMAVHGGHAVPVLEQGIGGGRRVALMAAVDGRKLGMAGVETVRRIAGRGPRVLVSGIERPAGQIAGIGEILGLDSGLLLLLL